MAQVREDPTLLPAAIAETLRYTPPVQLVPRQSERDAEFAGTTVPARGHRLLHDRRGQPRPRGLHRPGVPGEVGADRRCPAELGLVDAGVPHRPVVDVGVAATGQWRAGRRWWSSG
ncbi:cytochrome P450 [Streptomyces sp. NPDC098781]|uniref:cytochrome P450 n=1 Tax=Streptomyces sp. NPDC098781 TaxID=3366097 RepID=UPI0038007202